MSMYHDQHVSTGNRREGHSRVETSLRQMCLSMDQNLVQVFLQRNTTLSSLRSYRQEVQCDYSTHMPLCASWSMGTIESRVSRLRSCTVPTWRRHCALQFTEAHAAILAHRTSPPALHYHTARRRSRWSRTASCSVVSTVCSSSDRLAACPSSEHFRRIVHRRS